MSKHDELCEFMHVLAKRYRKNFDEQAFRAHAAQNLIKCAEELSAQDGKDRSNVRVVAAQMQVSF